MLQSNFTSPATAGTPALIAPTPQLSPVMIDYLSDPATVHEARMMLRSWFLSDILHGTANQERAFMGDVRECVYFYELLDEFLGQLVFNAIPARV